MTTIIDKFLEEAKNDSNPTSVFLSTGVKLQGYITNYDAETVLFSCQNDDNRIVIFKQYITTISRKLGKVFTDKPHSYQDRQSSTDRPVHNERHNNIID